MGECGDAPDITDKVATAKQEKKDIVKESVDDEHEIIVEMSVDWDRLCMQQGIVYSLYGCRRSPRY